MIRRPPKLVTTHSSGRYDVQSAGAYARYRGRGPLVTHTEAQEEDKILGGPNWGVINGATGPRSDPAIEYDKRFMDCLEKFVIPISDIEYRREGGSTSGRLWAAVGIFKIEEWEHPFLQAAVHWPRWSQPERRKTYVNGIHNLARFIKFHWQDYDQKLHYRITGDWNQDLRNASVRKHIEKEFAKPIMGPNPFSLKSGKHWDWVGYMPDAGGTFGRKLYDGSLVSGGLGIVDTYLLPDNKESDHRPYGSELFEYK